MPVLVPEVDVELADPDDPEFEAWVAELSAPLEASVDEPSEPVVKLGNPRFITVLKASV